MSTNRLHEIEAQGTAVWIDNLSRELFRRGTLEQLIADDGLECPGDKAPGSATTPCRLAISFAAGPLSVTALGVDGRAR